jgi:hypothetical protein
VPQDAPTHRERVASQVDAVRGRLHLRGPRLAFRELYRRLPDALDEGEQLIALGDGSLEEQPRGNTASSTYVVLTDRKLFGLDPAVEPLPVEAVTEVAAVEARAGAAFRVSTMERGDLLVRLADANIAEEMVAALESPPSQPESTPFDALERLSRLHEAGVLSKREFKAKKAELLERI